MKYLGGKYMIGKEISKIMLELINPDSISGYLEPFCGALGVLKHMNKYYENCEASDIHSDLISLWKSVQKGDFNPPEQVSEEDYLKIKEYKSPNAIKAFVGFGLSFGGRYFAAYAPKYTNGKKEDYLQAAKNSMNKLHHLIQGVKFKNTSYLNLNPENKVIYCDPPYQKTKFPIKYRTGTKDYDVFNNVEFWDVMRKWSKKNYVFISETTAPDDFVCIWEKKSHRSAAQSNKTRYKNSSESYDSEKLFIHGSRFSELCEP
jgi:DNA adenine methylase